MKLSPKQKNDLEVSMYFIPQTMKHIPISDEDIQMYFEWSEQGKHKDKVGGMPYKMNGFNALVQGKEWRGIHMQMYEEGVLDSTIPYADILEDTPRSVVDFIKKEMFKGIDAEQIETCYQQIINNICPQ